MFTCSSLPLLAIKNIVEFFFLHETNLILISFHFVTMVFSACCLLFLINMFFELLDYLLFYKTNLEREKEVLILENQQFKKEVIHQKELNKKAQKKIKKLQKEIRQSYN